MTADAPLLALTLWQPWAWCIAHGAKRGAIVAIATLAGAVRVARDERGAFTARRWIGDLTPERVAEVERDPWTQGTWGWLLEDVVAIEPVPCPGNRKLWAVPPPIAEAVQAAEAAARRRRGS